MVVTWWRGYWYVPYSKFHYMATFFPFRSSSLPPVDSFPPLTWWNESVDARDIFIKKKFNCPVATCTNKLARKKKRPGGGKDGEAKDIHYIYKGGTTLNSFGSIKTQRTICPTLHSIPHIVSKNPLPFYSWASRPAISETSSRSIRVFLCTATHSPLVPSVSSTSSSRRRAP